MNKLDLSLSLCHCPHPKTDELLLITFLSMYTQWLYERLCLLAHCKSLQWYIILHWQWNNTERAKSSLDQRSIIFMSIQTSKNHEKMVLLFYHFLCKMLLKNTMFFLKSVDYEKNSHVFCRCTTVAQKVLNLATMIILKKGYSI